MFIQTDDRIGNTNRYFYTDEWRTLMLVSQEIVDCSGFILYKRAEADPARTGGTSFRVCLEGGFGYYVTAKHVIDEIRKNSCDNKVLLRTDMDGGSPHLVESHVDDWIAHPSDVTVDVAVLSLNRSDGAGVSIPGKTLRIKLFPLSSETIASQEVMAREGIGTGDEVFVVGLFTSFYGKNKNIPVVRIGNIAAMPDELIDTKWHDRSIEAYLIEASA